MTVLLFAGQLKSFLADFFLVSVPVCHLRKSLVAVVTLVGSEAPVHVNMVDDIVQLGVGLAAILADEQLVWAAGLVVGQQPLDIAQVVPLRVDAFFVPRKRRVAPMERVSSL